MEKLRADIKRGEVVWVEFGSSTWPALVIDGNDCYQPITKKEYSWVYWFGDYRVSEIANKNILDFFRAFNINLLSKTQKTFQRGVIEALRVIAVRLKNYDLIKPEQLENWAKDNFNDYQFASNYKLIKYVNVIPNEVKDHLKDIVNKQVLLKKFKKNSTISVGSISKTQNLLFGKSRKQVSRHTISQEKMSPLKAAIQNLKATCIGCENLQKNIVSEHPLFIGGLCQDCKGNIDIAVANKSENLCIICGKAGNIVCNKDDCGRSFCFKCIDRLITPLAHEVILKVKNWSCYLCKSYNFYSHGKIKKKPTDSVKISKVFVVPEVRLSQELEKNKALTILSLFSSDQLANERVLNSLHFKVDKYYYCSDLPSETYLSQNLVALRDIEALSNEKIKDMCPVDLFLADGNSSACKPTNAEEFGHFEAFYEFFRILSSLRVFNQDQFVLWYFQYEGEDRFYLDTVSRFLMCPSLTVVVSSRLCNIWSNIPALEQLKEILPKTDSTPTDNVYIILEALACLSNYTNSNLDVE